MNEKHESTECVWSFFSLLDIKAALDLERYKYWAHEQS